MAKKGVRKAAVKKAQTSPRYKAVRDEIRKQAKEARELSMEIERQARIVEDADKKSQKLNEELKDLQKRVLAGDEEAQAEWDQLDHEAYDKEAETLDDEAFEAASYEAQLQKALKAIPGVPLSEIHKASKKRK
jgi:predicted methyltransferase